MSYLIDTCVVSEFAKPKPSPAVFSWLDTVDESQVFISTISLGEILSGISRLPDGKRKQNLQRWFQEDLLQRFKHRTVGFNQKAALHWGQMTGLLIRQGQTPAYADSQIAAIALTYQWVIVTRNISDFERFGVPLFNPWQN